MVVRRDAPVWNSICGTAEGAVPSGIFSWTSTAGRKGPIKKNLGGRSRAPRVAAKAAGGLPWRRDGLCYMSYSLNSLKRVI